MNMQELKELVYQGEKVDIECKKAESSVPKSVYESYSAFANTKGGYIMCAEIEDYTRGAIYNTRNREPIETKRGFLEYD